MSDFTNLALSALDVRDGLGDMTPGQRQARWEWEHDVPVAHILQDVPALTVEDHRALVALDTAPIGVIEPLPPRTLDQKMWLPAAIVGAAVVFMAVRVVLYTAWGI